MPVVGLCCWFSFAFSFKTELSPWELMRRAPTGGGAQGTLPILQGRLGGPPFPGNLSALAHMSLFSPNASHAHSLYLRHSRGARASNCFLCLLCLYVMSAVPPMPASQNPNSCSHVPTANLLCSSSPEQLGFSTSRCHVFGPLCSVFSYMYCVCVCAASTDSLLQPSASEELGPSTIGGATQLTPTSLTLLWQCQGWQNLLLAGKK